MKSSLPPLCFDRNDANPAKTVMLRKRSVGWAKERQRRAHHPSPSTRLDGWARLRFARPTDWRSLHVIASAAKQSIFLRTRWRLIAPPALAMTRRRQRSYVGWMTGYKLSRHRPRKRTIQYSRGSSDLTDKPRRTGFPACAGNDGRRCRAKSSTPAVRSSTSPGSAQNSIRSRRCRRAASACS